LKEIKKPNRDHARRLLQCLVVAIRPLGVEELAEILAVDFDDADGMPKLNANWRWDDEEQALLASCSSLIAIVESYGSRFVQFSHFSVREFLTSTRLATLSGDASRYHIALEPAHTILAQACMGVLLRSDDRDEQSDNGIGDNSPLAGYAARHWVAHAQFEHVSSYLRTSMECLFDLDRPYFTNWPRLYDIDTRPSFDSIFGNFAPTPSTRKPASPLYYAALCGFQDLVEYLIAKYPQHINANGGYCVNPLVAALAGRHFQTAEFLRHNGADPNVQGSHGSTSLRWVAYNGDVELVKVLLNLGADVNIRNVHGKTALDAASGGSSFLNRTPNYPRLLANVARLLLDHGADIDARDIHGWTALHTAAFCGRIEVVRVLLEHGAIISVKDKNGKTPFEFAEQHDEIVDLLLEHGAQ